MTRSLRAIASVSLSAALVCSAASVIRAQAPNAAAAAANALFADAVAKESAVRRALAGDMAVPSVLKAVRTVIADYEAVVRRYPSSGFSDDALWRGAKLSREAFDAFHETREKTTAVRLLRQLAAGYPSSRFSPLTAAEMNWLNTNQSVLPATGTTRAQAPVQRALAVEPIPAARGEATEPPRIIQTTSRVNEPAARAGAAPVAEATRLPETARVTDGPRLAEISAVKPPATLINVKAVRRTVLPTVVRVVVELDAEVGYRDERLENPTRVFVDIPSTRANLALIDQTLRFDGDADIVRQIRIGRHPNNITRVVLEGAGIASYSIYPLYNPYRLVIDCIRTAPAAEAKADSPSASPVNTVALPPTLAPAPSSAPVAPPPSAAATATPVVPPAPLPTPTRQPARVAPAPSAIAAAPAETERPAWVETLRRRPGSAKPTTNTTTAALPPIPTPNLRSKPVSGAVPLPSAVVAALPPPVEPPVVRPLVPKQPSSREPAAAKPTGTATDIVATKETTQASAAVAAASPVAAVATVATATAPATSLAPVSVVPGPPAAASTPAAVSTAVTPSAAAPAPVSAPATVPTASTVAANTPSVVAATNAATLSPVSAVAAADTRAEELEGDFPTLATRAGSLSAAPSPKPAERNLAGGLSMARQLGLGVSRIVIDAGHGGHDPGAQSHGVTEADLVLDVALRLEKLLAKIPGIEVLLTRRNDQFIPLQERTAIANREGADLFLSIHANASNTPSAQGIETYFLNFASNRNAAAVAARENATSGQTMGELQDVVKAIAASNKRDESRDFATYVQRELMNSLKNTDKGARDLGVKQAPFVVLVGAAMPSILAEISFITNPQEAKLLKQNAYRQRIAQALFEGVRRYQSSLKSTLAFAQQQN